MTKAEAMKLVIENPKLAAEIIVAAVALNEAAQQVDFDAGKKRAYGVAVSRLAKLDALIRQLDQ